VVVGEAHLPRAHQLAGDRGGGRVADEFLELGNPLPVAEVLEEAARIVRPRRDERPLARLRQVAPDSPLEQCNLLGRERTADADGAVALEVLVPAHGAIVVTMRSCWST